MERQWSELRRGDGETQGRTLTLNLICRCGDAAEAGRMAQSLWALGTRFPARVFLIAPRPAGAAMRVAADASGSELAELAMAPERAASLVAPLLLGDLPVFLLWRGADPRGNGEFQQWAGLAQRVMMDSDRAGLGPAALGELIGKLPAACRLTDLSWARLTPWRQLLSQAMECRQGAVALGSLAQVSIAADGGTGSLPALLFAGWMAEQLQWSPLRRMGDAELECGQKKGAPLRLTFQAGDKRDWQLRRVLVEAAGGADRLQVEIQHEAKRIAMQVHEDQTEIGRWAGAAASASAWRSDAALLAEELSIRGGDRLFERAVARGLEIAEALGANPA
jgi:glucose-6-phosphate dehydrogenase assembly protein OpcA